MTIVPTQQSGGDPSRTWQPVTFRFVHPTARTVCVAGSFNQWHPSAKPLLPMGGGRWMKQSFLPPGTYQYLLVADGQWLPDPTAEGSVANPFGGRNSLLTVGWAAHRAALQTPAQQNATTVMWLPRGT